MIQVERKVKARAARKRRVRKKINGTGARPRLSVFKSLKHVYAQVIDDEKGVTLAAASTFADKLGAKSGNERASELGKLIAERATAKGVTAVVFDRAGYRYHGNVKALADAAREAGLKL